MTKQSSPRLIEVTWTDSYTHDVGWESIQNYVDHVRSTAFLIKTVGFLIHRDSKVVVLSPSLDPLDKCSGIWVIPTGVIKKIRRL